MTARQFGHYELESLIGVGGMGEVWRATDTRRDRVVALKLLPEALGNDKDFINRFRRESHVAARLREPHVVPIHDYGEIDGRLYIDMRLVDGRDLGDLLKDGPITPARAVAMLSQVADALEAAHADGLVHRDIKPSNVLVTANDFVYVVDFGIARSIGSTRTSLTMTGATVGTLDYMAPERFTNQPLDGRVDVYSLACVLAECLTATRPFPGEDLASLLYAHLYTDPPRPSRMVEGIPPALDEVVSRGMAKRPEDRYATPCELVTAARDALDATRTDGPAPRSLATEPAVVPAGPLAARPTLAGAAAPPVGDQRTLPAPVDIGLRTQDGAHRSIDPLPAPQLPPTPWGQNGQNGHNGHNGPNGERTERTQRAERTGRTGGPRVERGQGWSGGPVPPSGPQAPDRGDRDAAAGWRWPGRSCWSWSPRWSPTCSGRRTRPPAAVASDPTAGPSSASTAPETRAAVALRRRTGRRRGEHRRPDDLRGADPGEPDARIPGDRAQRPVRLHRQPGRGHRHRARHDQQRGHRDHPDPGRSAAVHHLLAGRHDRLRDHLQRRLHVQRRRVRGDEFQHGDRDGRRGVATVRAGHLPRRLAALRPAAQRGPGGGPRHGLGGGGRLLRGGPEPALDRRQRRRHGRLHGQPRVRGGLGPGPDRRRFGDHHHSDGPGATQHRGLPGRHPGVGGQLREQHRLGHRHGDQRRRRDDPGRRQATGPHVRARTAGTSTRPTSTATPSR